MTSSSKGRTVADVRELLITHGGGFLRNVEWVPGDNCALCAGIPNGDYSTCYNCSSWQYRSDLSDRLGFVTYAVAGSQSGRVMYGYKDTPPSLANRRVVRLMHAYAVTKHWSCINGSDFGPVTHWATVPSLRGRQGLHPLRSIVEPVLNQRLEEAGLVAAPHCVQTRDLRSDNFEADVDDGAHVLLIEDTWVGGGRVQSAAQALKVGGAASVTTLVLARWMEPGRGSTKAFLASVSDDFDPDRCPFTGGACP